MAKKKITESSVKIPETDPYRTAPQRSVVSYKDVGDLPKSKYVLFVEPSPMQSLLVPVDGVIVNETQIIGYLTGPEATEPIRFSPMIPWYMVDRSVTDIIAAEEMHRRTVQDNKLMEALHKELYPEAKEGKNGKGTGNYL